MPGPDGSVSTHAGAFIRLCDDIFVASKQDLKQARATSRKNKEVVVRNNSRELSSVEIGSVNSSYHGWHVEERYGGDNV